MRRHHRGRTSITTTIGRLVGALAVFMAAAAPAGVSYAAASASASSGGWTCTITAVAPPNPLTGSLSNQLNGSATVTCSGLTATANLAITVSVVVVELDPTSGFTLSTCPLAANNYNLCEDASMKFTAKSTPFTFTKGKSTTVTALAGTNTCVRTAEPGTTTTLQEYATRAMISSGLGTPWVRTVPANDSYSCP